MQQTAAFAARGPGKGTGESRCTLDPGGEPLSAQPYVEPGAREDAGPAAAASPRPGRGARGRAEASRSGDADSASRPLLHRLTLALAALLLGCAGCGGATPAEPKPPPPAIYGGAPSCAGCHAAASRAWESSPHGRHGSFAARPPGDADGAVGSKWMQAYVKRRPDGLHAIVPECYDLRSKSWRPVRQVLEEIAGPFIASSPARGAPLEQRTFETDCAGCHASMAWYRLDPGTGAMRSGWASLSIDCEACHGPAKAHADAWTRLAAPTPLPRLEDLSPRAKTAICARCHGGPPTQGDVTPADAEHFVGVLEDRRGVFPDGRAAGQVYQYPSFVRSPCYRKGGLTCTDCHDAHGPGLRGAPDVDASCRRCHPGLASPSHTHHDARGTGSSCIECHMPRLLTGLTAHQRDHRISVPLPMIEDVPDACTACHKDKTKAWATDAWKARWGEPPRADLDAIDGIRRAREGDAHARPLLEAALTHPDPFYRANAVRLLGLPDVGRTDPVPEVRRAALEAVPRTADGTALLSRFLEDPEPALRARAAVELFVRTGAQDARRQGDLETAVRLHRGWVEGNLLLGGMRLAGGNPSGAADAFLTAVTEAPSLDLAWRGLAASLARDGRKQEAVVVREARARTLAGRVSSSPGDVDLAETAADAYLLADQPREARRVLDHAMRSAHGPARERLARKLRTVEAREAEGRHP